ncbi:MAG: hypothetical protein HC921_03625 [Synechococcaceae cyanobacterium SM2_3_1]|nr:hypothetical protein [Synechococcaceae cyanobacterium SM2_3_1]
MDPHLALSRALTEWLASGGLYEVSVAMGQLSQPNAESELNPTPMVF